MSAGPEATTEQGHGSTETAPGPALLRRLLTERHRSWWTSAVVVGIAVVVWQPISFKVAPGLDYSWIAGISMATDRGLVYGRDIVWTYGPLGFLTTEPTLWISSLGALAVFYLLLERVATAAALFLGARRSFSPAMSLVAAFVAGSVAADLNEIAILFVVAVWALRSPATGRRALLLGLAVGAVAAVELLSKISVGVAFSLMAAVLLASLPDRGVRSLLAGAVGGIVTFVALWLAVGQPLDAIPDYGRGALQISLGYTAAMSGDTPALAWIWFAAPVILLAGAWQAWRSLSGSAMRQRIGVVSVWFIFWFFAFKEGVVREDAGHLATFMEAMLVGWFGFYWRREQRGQALTGMVALAVITLAILGISLTTAIQPGRAVTSAVRDLRIAASSGWRSRLIDKGRARVRKEEPLDAGALSLVMGHTVAVYPSETALAWAYNLNWRPMPVIQSYAAYTPALDGLDARFLSSGGAPERIIVNANLTIDGRVLAFDQPRTTRTLLCRYHVLNAGTTGYVVLGRNPDRCSAPRLLAVEVGAWRQPVPVPAAPASHALVSVDISGVGISGLESLASLLVKPGKRTILVNGQPHRLVEANAGDGLPLSVTGALDFPPPIAQVPQATTVAVDRTNPPTGGRPITYRFYWQAYTAR